MTDEDLMRRAIGLAREAIAAGQMPVAAVIARDGSIVAEAHNTVWRDTDPTAHAEMNCLRRAASLLKTIDLVGTTIYATLEPCPMCLAAIHWAKVDRAVFGAAITDSMAVGFNELDVPAASLARLGGSRVVVEGGVLREECVALLDEWKRAGRSAAY
jgi:tRNA(Arg) A34 adenosine deaminase TadA